MNKAQFSWSEMNKYFNMNTDVKMNIDLLEQEIQIDDLNLPKTGIQRRFKEILNENEEIDFFENNGVIMKKMKKN